MFTGCIIGIGLVTNIILNQNGFKLVIISSYNFNINVGDSISCSGICLTVVLKLNNYFEVEVWEYTLKSSWFSKIKKYSIINIENSLKFNSDMHGHFLTGHNFSISKVKFLINCNKYLIIEIFTPYWILKKIFLLNSIGLNGVSLTVIKKSLINLTVLCIFYTLNVTSYCRIKNNDLICIEIYNKKYY